ncbi:MAG: hypothetical protein ACREOB_01505 [Thermodesulfobacteriota bacterium]
MERIPVLSASSELRVNSVEGYVFHTGAEYSFSYYTGLWHDTTGVGY